MTMLESRNAAASGTLRTDAAPADAARADAPRQLQQYTLDDVLSLGGAVLGSLALVWIVYERLLPTSGGLGFLVCWYLAFLLLYAAVSSLSNPGPVVRDRVAAAVVYGGAAVVAIGLISVVLYTFWGGRNALLQSNIFTEDMARTGPRDQLTEGGVLHAIAGSLIQITIAIVVTLPLGVGTAIYMTEVGGKLSRVVRTVVEAMTALPSIVAGLFIYSTLIILLGLPNSGLAAAMAISVMMLPIIARASDVVLRVVPGGLREASLALGASRWQTVWRVVLPTARPGLATALILGVARGIGETSPVLLTSGASTYFNLNPVVAPMNSLPLFVFNLVRSGEPLYIARAFGAAGILLGLVLVLFVIARLVARQRVGRR